jgi:Acyclic terpene utilisation family protein AtuA
MTRPGESEGPQTRRDAVSRRRGGSGVVRIGNASGFYGDRFSAVEEMLTGGPLDVLTGDYLAELTMLILGRDRLKDPRLGYAKTFLQQLETGLGLALDRGVRIVSNAGGLNPAGLAEAIHELAGRLGLAPKVGYVEGDDLLDRAGELGLGRPLTANAYLGAWGIAEALTAGADVVVTGRVTDASVIVGPAAAYHGWTRDDLDALAGAVVAGHVIECGCQATGGNFAFFTELPDLGRPGFPIAEIDAAGNSVITKHDGTDGAVTIDTVTAQLLYEVAGPRYPGPDVTARLDTVSLSLDGPDRVSISGVRGEPPPPAYKVSLNSLGGYRNEVTFVLTGLDIDAKAELVEAQLGMALTRRPPAEVRWTLVRVDRPDAATEEQASALLRCTVRDPDAEVVGRAFSNAAVELALASYPGFHLTAPPGDAAPYGVFTAGYVDVKEVHQVVVLPDGTRREIEPAGETAELTGVAEPELPEPLPTGATRNVPLGAVAGARSGDKGGGANIGVWVRTDDAWRWLAHYLTVDELRRLLPETTGLTITRHVLPNLRAVNFVVEGLLGEGVASQSRFDPQAKAVGEWLRSRYVDLPEVLL